MVYVPGSPQGNQKPSTSRAQIAENFTQLNSQFAIDHVAFDSGTNNGYHKQITYQAPLTPGAPSGSRGIEYAKTVSAKSELHYQNATKESQITFSGLTTASGEGGMPGGLQIRAGAGSSSIAGTTNTFSTQFPTACVAVALAADNSNNIVQVFSKSATNFVSKSAQGTCSLYYIAIGY